MPCQGPPLARACSGRGPQHPCVHAPGWAAAHGWGACHHGWQRGRLWRGTRVGCVRTRGREAAGIWGPCLRSVPRGSVSAWGAARAGPRRSHAHVGRMCARFQAAQGSSCPSFALGISATPCAQVTSEEGGRPCSLWTCLGPGVLVLWGCPSALPASFALLLMHLTWRLVSPSPGMGTAEGSTGSPHLCPATRSTGSSAEPPCSPVSPPTPEELSRTCMEGAAPEVTDCSPREPPAPPGSPLSQVHRGPERQA